MLSGDHAVPARLHPFEVDQVEVDDAEIRIIGRKAVLADLVMGGKPLRPECPVLFASGAPDTIRTCGFGGDALSS